MFEISDPRDVRRSNLRYLVEMYGQSVVAKRMGKPDRQIADILAQRKTFGEKVAHGMEAAWKKSTGEQLDLSSPGMVRDRDGTITDDKHIDSLDSANNATSGPGIETKYFAADIARRAIVDIVLGGPEQAPAWMGKSTLMSISAAIEGAQEQSPDSAKKSDPPTRRKA